MDSDKSPDSGSYEVGFSMQTRTGWTSDLSPQTVKYVNMGPYLMEPSPRKSKRMIPDGEKDDRYWEKRKRNNDAAKRSRENKRRQDVDLRHRLCTLEAENSLLRKELAFLKTKFGIPVDQRIIPVDEQVQLLDRNSCTKENMNSSTPSSTPTHVMSLAVAPPSFAMMQAMAEGDVPVKKRKRLKQESDYCEVEAAASQLAQPPATYFSSHDGQFSTQVIWAGVESQPQYYSQQQASPTPMYQHSLKEMQEDKQRLPSINNAFGSRSELDPAKSQQPVPEDAKVQHVPQPYIPFDHRASLGELSAMGTSAGFNLVKPKSQDIADATDKRPQFANHKAASEKHILADAEVRSHSDVIKVQLKDQMENKKDATGSHISSPTKVPFQSFEQKDPASSDESDTHGPRLSIENEELRDQVRQLSVEVAKMKHFVMKDVF